MILNKQKKCKIFAPYSNDKSALALGRRVATP